MSSGHSRKQYLTIFAILVVFTLLEIGVVYTGLARGLIISCLVALACAKAGAVALYFMHLKFETKVLRATVGLPMLLPPLYAVVLMLESVWHAMLK
jgi:caa(3)-type oxidase subunit IV